MKRIETLREKMAEEGVDLIVLAPGAHLGWLTGIRPHADERPLLFCVTAKDAGFLMPSLEAEDVRRQTDFPLFEWSDAEGPEGALEKMFETFSIQSARSIVIDEAMRADHAGLIQDRLLNAKRQFGESTLGALRARKDEDEYAKLKRNAQIADRAMQKAWDIMRLGMTELEVAAIVRDCFKEDDAVPLFTIIGAGGNGAMPHHHTGDTVLKEGDAVVMDIGAGRDGFSSDITRMAVIGTPPDGYLEVHAIVEAAVQAAMAVARPGVKAQVLDDAARKVITGAGYGEYFMHRLGHGMGVEVHEPPFISASSQSVLDENMVFSIEPGIYLPGRFGLRLEDIVIMRTDGPEILSSLPRDVQIIS
ncbi:aminopeptidase P family protein [Labrenzia sp. CE80]|uniref:M24 family metallopeptidase n=1 Tax=Labrenzia sp. CE80 TaxID=1788986 RepID=UPI00129AC294|nr:aminopeptidase P family protein [Labrenzia sp. CE80]